ncbi:MAG: hypothetical protein CL858_21070 [Cupriavidus sp.]|nr:hypothetical protein [Cupriavidus sp.]
MAFFAAGFWATGFDLVGLATGFAVAFFAVTAGAVLRAAVGFFMALATRGLRLSLRFRHRRGLGPCRGFGGGRGSKQERLRLVFSTRQQKTALFLRPFFRYQLDS